MLASRIRGLQDKNYFLVDDYDEEDIDLDDAAMERRKALRTVDWRFWRYSSSARPFLFVIFLFLLLLFLLTVWVARDFTNDHTPRDLIPIEVELSSEEFGLPRSVRKLRLGAAALAIIAVLTQFSQLFLSPAFFFRKAISGVVLLLFSATSICSLVTFLIVINTNPSLDNCNNRQARTFEKCQDLSAVGGTLLACDVMLVAFAGGAAAAVLFHLLFTDAWRVDPNEKERRRLLADSAQMPTDNMHIHHRRRVRIHYMLLLFIGCLIVGVLSISLNVYLFRQKAIDRFVDSPFNRKAEESGWKVRNNILRYSCCAIGCILVVVNFAPMTLRVWALILGFAWLGVVVLLLVAVGLDTSDYQSIAKIGCPGNFRCSQAFFQFTIVVEALTAALIFVYLIVEYLVHRNHYPKYKVTKHAPARFGANVACFGHQSVQHHDDAPLGNMLQSAPIITQLGYLVYGKVVVKLHKATNLIRADVTASSDPFLIVKVGEAHAQSSVVTSNINPIWNEILVLEVSEFASYVTLSVYDYDTVGDADFLGLVQIPVLHLLMHETLPHQFQLKNSLGMQSRKDRGTLYCTVEYKSFSEISACMYHVVDNVNFPVRENNRVTLFSNAHVLSDAKPSCITYVKDSSQDQELRKHQQHRYEHQKTEDLSVKQQQPHSHSKSPQLDNRRLPHHHHSTGSSFFLPSPEKPHLRKKRGGKHGTPAPAIGGFAMHMHNKADAYKLQEDSMQRLSPTPPTTPTAMHQPTWPDFDSGREHGDGHFVPQGTPQQQVQQRQDEKSDREENSYKVVHFGTALPDVQPRIGQNLKFRGAKKYEKNLLRSDWMQRSSLHQASGSDIWGYPRPGGHHGDSGAHHHSEGTPEHVQYQHNRCWEQLYSAMWDAKHFIFIVGWQLDHSVRLVRERPYATRTSTTTTVGQLLSTKAQQGVQVFMLLDSDIAGTFDSKAQKEYFDSTGVKCAVVTRVGAKGTVTYSTHHQKSVSCDAPPLKGQQCKYRIISFLGGLDMFKGRYEIPECPLYSTMNTLHADDFYQGIPGIVKEWGPRMPWHDIHCKLEGPVAYDVITNFRQRWETQGLSDVKLPEIEEPTDSTQDHMGIYNDDASPESWHCQYFRSIDNTSAKSVKEVDHSIQQAYIHHIRRAQRFIYIENQYFIGSSAHWHSQRDIALNRIPLELIMKIVEKIIQGKRFMVYVVVPLFPEDMPELARHEILYWETRTIEMMYYRVALALEAAQNRGKLVDALPTDFLMFYALVTRDNKRGSPASTQRARDSSQRSVNISKRLMVYVHSKMMIVDDEYIILGSANINQRSMAGDRDTEMAVGACQPNKSKHLQQKGEVYAFRMNLFVEHTYLSDPTSMRIFSQPESLKCVRYMNNLADHNWTIFTGAKSVDMYSHLVTYPIRVSAMGFVNPHVKHFPDSTRRVGGRNKIIPSLVTA